MPIDPMLPHMNPSVPQHNPSSQFRGLPPMRDVPANHHRHDSQQSYSREVEMTNGRLTARPPPSLAMDTGPQPILIDTPPPSANRTTLPPMDAAFEPNMRRGSITDPSMHATSMADQYRSTNGTMPRPSQPLSYQPHINPRPRSIRDESAIPDSPSISERSSFDDSPHPGHDRLHSFTSEHPSYPSLSRRSSANSWRPAVNGDGTERQIFKGFTNQLTNFHLGSTPSLSPSNSSSRLHQNGSEYAYSYQAPPHSVVDRHLSIYRNKAGEEKIAPHQAPPVMALPPKAVSDRYPTARTYPYPHPNAPEPTTGYPWAFPDERDEEENRREASHQSIQSLQSIQSDGQYPMHPSVMGLHPSHEEALRQSQAPYSRSPELRQSHKESERKRRKEQKQLFDELRDILPVDKTLKTSKWEVLSRSVNYINDLIQFNNSLERLVQEQAEEIKTLRSQVNRFERNTLE